MYATKRLIIDLAGCHVIQRVRIEIHINNFDERVRNYTA